MVQSDPRNAYLNAAFRPKWAVPDDPSRVTVPQGDTNFDPFIGTGWGDWLDAAGASDPGGVRMAGSGLPHSAAAMSQTPFAPITDSGAPLGSNAALSGLQKVVKGKPHAKSV